MNLGFELLKESAKPKRAVEDAPTQQPMRPAKLRRNPDSDQKAVRRRLKQKTAAEKNVELEFDVAWRFENHLGWPTSTAAEAITPYIAEMKGGDKLHLKVNNVDYLIYYDAEEATGDDGRPVRGDEVGEYEVLLGTDVSGKVIFRQHVSPHGSSGYGNSGAKAYAAEQVAMAISKSLSGHVFGSKEAISEDRKGHSVTCPQCGATELETRIWPDKSRLDAHCKNCGWKGVKVRPKKESNVNVNQREAELLSAMAGASLSDQRVLAAELEEVRAQRTAALQDERDVDIAAGVIRDQLTSVLVHGMNTTATDWLGEMTEDDIDVEGAVRIARAEAGAWFERTSAEVKADRDEFAEQAMGKARVCASRFGSASDAAERAFLDTAGFLHKRATLHTADSAVVVDPLPDSGPGPQAPEVEGWSGVQEYERNAAENDVGERYSSLHEAAGDSPGKVDREQSGNAESTITDYDTMGADAEPFDEKQTGPLQETGPYAVPSTRAPNVTGARELRSIAWDVVKDWGDDIDRAAAPYLAAMTTMASVDDSYGDTPGQAVVAYFLRNASGWQGGTSDEIRAELGSMLDPTYAKVAAVTVVAGDPQNGYAQSHDKQVEVGNPNDRPMWPWDLPLIGDEGGDTGRDASDVSSTHTPGQNVADYPQPGSKKKSSVEAGGGVANFGDKQAPPFGSSDGDEETKEATLTQQAPSIEAWAGIEPEPVQLEAALVAEGEYHYVHKRGDKWVITQKGTGKVLSTHDSEEEAKASFRAMMQSKHGGSFQTEPTNEEKLAAFRQTVASNIGRADPFVREAGSVSDYKVGDRVELHPATDAWMMGDRYGEVAKVGREKVHVKMDRSGRTLRMHPDNIRGRVD